MLSIDVMKNMKMGQSVQVTTDKECFYALITEITDTKVSVISETGKQHTLLFSDMGGKWKAEMIPSFTDSEGCTYIKTTEVVRMLKEMQVSAAKCCGFIAGMVTQAWVIRDMLGNAIEKLGGRPYVIRNNKMYDSEEE